MSDREMQESENRAQEAVSEPVQAHQEPVSEEKAVEPVSSRRLLRGMALLGLLFAIAGALIGLHTFADATLSHILSPDSAGLDYQEVTDKLPVPKLLDWNLEQIETLMDVRSVIGAGLVMAELVLFGTLWFGACRTLNPTFRLFQIAKNPPTGDKTAAATRPVGTGLVGENSKLGADIEAHGLAKSAILLLITGLPVALVWFLFRSAPAHVDRFAGGMRAGLYLVRWSPAWAARLIALGAALWVGFHRDGLAGDFNSTRLNPSRRALPRLALKGAVWGLAVFLIGRYAVPAALEPLLTNYQTLGTFNLAEWKQVAWHYQAGMIAVWFAAGALLYFIAKSRFTRRQTPLLIVPLVAVLAAVWAEQLFSPAYFTARYDLTPSVLSAIRYPYRPDRGGTGIPDGAAAAGELARKLQIRVGTSPQQPERSVLIFREDGTIVNVRQNGYTVDGLSADPASVGKITTFLAQKRYLSALSWVAVKHLFDLCTLHFDTTSAIDTLLDDLSYGPHLQQSGLVLEALFFICSASPDNLALLDKWADPARFGYPDRFAFRLIGDLYRRFGAVDKALVWYRKADMPHSFLARIRAEQPLFHQGHVTGILRLNGKPLAGVQIGLSPWRLNGLPPNLEPLVANAIGEIYAPRPSPPLFDSFHPAPFAFRWISASTVTDSRGAFTLDYLTEGQYRLICTLPSQYKLTPPLDRSLRVTNPPVPFALHYGNPSVDLGVIDLTLNESGQ